MVRAILTENPDLATAIEAADEEGAAMFAGAYVPGVEFMVDTLEGGLLVPEAVYGPMRATMVRHPSLALQN
jgi:hypothetical protein